MKKGLKSLYFLLFISVFILGCRNNEDVVPTDTNLKTIALTQEEVTGFNVAVSIEQPSLTFKDTTDEYTILFNDNKDTLSNKVFIFKTAEDAGNNFIKSNIPGVNKVNLDNLGDEGLAFITKDSIGNEIISIWFKKKNLIANLEITNSNLDEAVSYAKKIEAKIA